MARISKGVRSVNVKFPKGNKSHIRNYDTKTGNIETDYIPESDNSDIEGIKQVKEIVSIVGGVVRTLKSFENSRGETKAVHQDPSMVQHSVAIKENTKIMERLSDRMTMLGLEAKINTKALINKTKEGAKNKIVGAKNTIMDMPKNTYNKVKGIMASSTKSLLGGMKKMLNPLNTLKALGKTVGGGFKMIDWTLNKFLGPLFLDMAKSIAKLALLYVLIEGIRQAIHGLMSTYEEGYEAFVEKFGDWSESLMDFAEAIENFQKDVKDKGFLGAIKDNFIGIASSFASVVGTAIVRTFDHVAVMFINLLSKIPLLGIEETTVGEYRNLDTEKLYNRGEGSTIGREKEWGMAHARKTRQKEMAEDGMQYLMLSTGIEGSMYNDDGSRAFSQDQLLNSFRRTNSEEFAEFSNMIRDRDGVEVGSDEHKKAMYEFLYDEEKRKKLSGIIGDMGGMENFQVVAKELITTLRAISRGRGEDGRISLGEKRDDIFDRTLDKEEIEKGILEGKALRYSSGNIPDLAKGDALKTLKQSEGTSHSKAIEDNIIRQFGHEFITDPPKDLNKGNVEETGVMDDIIETQKENMIANTNSIKELTETLAGFVGGLGNQVNMQNISKNTTVVNPRTSLNAINTGATL